LDSKAGATSRFQLERRVFYGRLATSSSGSPLFAHTSGRGGANHLLPIQLAGGFDFRCISIRASRTRHLLRGVAGIS
jgi:hypothetical protein